MFFGALLDLRPTWGHLASCAHGRDSSAMGYALTEMGDVMRRWQEQSSDVKWVIGGDFN